MNFSARFFLLLSLATLPLAADTYKVDRTHSDIAFEVRHLVSKVPGEFEDFDGTFELDTKTPAKSSVVFTIKAASIDTNLPDRDKHLRSEEFFHVEKYPTIDFRSTAIRAKGKNSYDVTGLLTLHGVSRRVTIPVSFLGFAKDPWGNEKAGFEAEFTVNRKDYGISWNKALDAGGALLGDDVKVRLNLQLNRAK